MATFLDIGLLQKFEIIFPFLFVFVVVWGLLSYLKFLGDNKFVHAIIALILAILALFSSFVSKVINGIAPWFVLIFIFIVLLFVALKTFGLSDTDIRTEFDWIKYAIVIVSFIILAYAIFDNTVWSEDAESSGDTVSSSDVGASGRSGITATLRSPAVLGLILIFLIAVFTIQKLSVE